MGLVPKTLRNKKSYNINIKEIGLISLYHGVVSNEPNYKNSDIKILRRFIV